MVTLIGLLPQLRGHTRIVVTGPQRSGTTISAKILSHELGYEYVAEEEIDINNLHKFFQLYDRKDRFVLQAPGLCSFAHALPGAIVLVRRSTEDIIRSQNRINWGEHESGELRKYFTTLGPISCVKYFAWDIYQKPVMTNAFELEYESLRGHPFWIDPDKRRTFTNRQTE